MGNVIKSQSSTYLVLTYLLTTNLLTFKVYLKELTLNLSLKKCDCV